MTASASSPSSGIGLVPDVVNELPRVFEQAKALHSLHGKPLAVVTAGRGAMRGWPAAQAKLARLSSGSVHVEVPGATHSSLLDDPVYARIAGRGVVGASASASRLDELRSE